MRKLFGTRRAAAILLSLALLGTLLAGCGQKQEAPAASSPAAEEKPSATAAAEPARTQPEETKPEVENNGGSYVRVGDRVYFRRYGKDATVKTAVFGQFTQAWNMTGCESELMAYDPAAGKAEVLYAESGCGPLWYADGGFYLCESVNGGNQVVWFAPDGSGRETLCAGEPLGVSEDGLLAVETLAGDQGYRAIYTFYRNKAAVGKLETESFLQPAGVTEQGLFLLGEDEAEESGVQHVWQITPDGKLLDLGALPATEYEDMYDVQADRFLDVGGKVVLGAGYYAGTGHFLSEYAFVEATPGKEGSAVEADASVVGEGAEDEEGNLPYPSRTGDGTYELLSHLPGELRIEYESGDLEVWEDGAWRVLTEGLCPNAAEGFGFTRLVQHMDYVDGTGYVTLALAHASPLDSIGWRDAFALAYMQYLAVKGDGTLHELSLVNHDAELYGDVWFIEEASTALWRQCDPNDESDYEVPYAYAIPIAEDADWEGGWETVAGGPQNGLVAGGDVGEGDYYGFDVPDVEPCGRLCLTLNSNGEIVSLARRQPDEVLAIDFDVPLSELSGAVEKLNLSRRDSDEDTYWFWAKLRVLEDGVRVRVERTPDDGHDGMVHLAAIDGAFVAGETLYDETLNRGDFVALHTSMPWHPELRVSVSKDGGWGSYVFGEDNYMHYETEESIHPELLLAAKPQANISDYMGGGTREALQGTWLYRLPPMEYIAMILTFTEDGMLYVGDGENSWEYTWELDSIYAGDWEAPDLLCLRTADGTSAGDYLLNVFRTDGEELLYLVQANNGDGVLSDILPGNGSGETQYSFTLGRSHGAALPGAMRRGETFPAFVVRYDRDRYCLWMQEAAVVDQDESGADILRAAPNAPCLPYHITGRDAILSLRACDDPAYPMQVFEATVDENGELALIF